MSFVRYDTYYERAMELALPRSKFSVVFTVGGNAGPVPATRYLRSRKVLFFLNRVFFYISVRGVCDVSENLSYAFFFLFFFLSDFFSFYRENFVALIDLFSALVLLPLCSVGVDVDS